MHAAQAMSLRLEAENPVRMSPATAAFFDSFRQEVPFLERDDHILTEDISKATAFIEEYD